MQISSVIRAALQCTFLLYSPPFANFFGLSCMMKNAEESFHIFHMKILPHHFDLSRHTDLRSGRRLKMAGCLKFPCSPN
jgi:hypothetical protein